MRTIGIWYIASWQYWCSLLVRLFVKNLWRVPELLSGLKSLLMSMEEKVLGEWEQAQLTPRIAGPSDLLLCSRFQQQQQMFSSKLSPPPTGIAQEHPELQKYVFELSRSVVHTRG